MIVDIGAGTRQELTDDMPFKIKMLGTELAICLLVWSLLMVSESTVGHVTQIILCLHPNSSGVAYPPTRNSLQKTGHSFLST